MLLFLSPSLGVRGQVEDWYATPRQVGEGTYYGAAGQFGGSCSISNGGTKPHPPASTALGGVSVTAALNRVQFGNSEPCGMCIQLTGDGTTAGLNPITTTFKAFINDNCPDQTCVDGDIDLAQDGDGRWNISWQAVPCEFGVGQFAGLQYSVEGGFNAFYIKFQVLNHRYPVRTVEFQSGAQWIPLVRTADNHWENSGTPAFPYPLVFPLTFRVRDVFGSQVSDTLSRVQWDQAVAGVMPSPTAAQFPNRHATGSTSSTFSSSGSSSSSGSALTSSGSSGTSTTSGSTADNTEATSGASSYGIFAAVPLLSILLGVFA